MPRARKYDGVVYPRTGTSIWWIRYRDRYGVPRRESSLTAAQMLRQGDAQVFKKYSQMKLQMKREALEKLNRRANEMAPTSLAPMCTVMMQ